MARAVSMVLGLALALGGAASLVAEQQQEEVVTAKAQKARGGGEDENIKSDSAVNDPAVTVPAPPDKGGEKTRQVLCGVVLDNWTPWLVRFYVDGSYWGTAGRWGVARGAAFAGTTTVYARAAFTDGSYLSWGPQIFNCRGGQVYRWKITR
jgi:hypothetical protein